MKKGLTSGLVLLVLGMVAGLLLGVVNAVTAPIIAANELRQKLEALEVFFDIPEDKTLQDFYDVTEVIANESGVGNIYVLRTIGTDNIIAAVYAVSQMGYRSEVSMLIAVNADETVRGYTFIGTGGTEGLGLVLNDLDFGMDGVAISTWETDFDVIGGASITSQGAKDGEPAQAGVAWCFKSVAERIATEGLGA